MLSNVATFLTLVGYLGSSFNNADAIKMHLLILFERLDMDRSVFHDTSDAFSVQLYCTTKRAVQFAIQFL